MILCPLQLKNFCRRPWLQPLLTVLLVRLQSYDYLQYKRENHYNNLIFNRSRSYWYCQQSNSAFLTYHNLVFQ